MKAKKTIGITLSTAIVVVIIICVVILILSMHGETKTSGETIETVPPITLNRV